jgi:competence protein ComFC
MVIPLDGNWHSGEAYDLHTTASTYLGVNEFGHDQYDNTRSPMGELLYSLKYRSDASAVPKIVELLDGISGIEKFDFLVPIPPTNKNRRLQPVETIAVALGKRRGVKVLNDLLHNSGADELKGITDPVARDELLQAAITISEPARVKGKKILLVDDLYRSGSTFRVATQLIYKSGEASIVSVLAMTKTRSHR